MISNFYRRYSRLILGMVLLSFGPLWFFAESIKSNNDIETWLPQNTDVRKAYEEFKQDFGAEEVIVQVDVKLDAVGGVPRRRDEGI